MSQAAKTECTKIILENYISKVIFVHIVCITLQYKPLEHIYAVQFMLVQKPPFGTIDDNQRLKNLWT